MPRIRRKISKTNIYHIMCRGNNKSDIFLDDEDCLYYLDILKKIKKDKKIFILAYCLMKNHIHLLCDMKEESISLIMKKINVSYAYYFNKKYLRIGHLFQDRFKSECVEDERYLLTVVRYIHNNPVKAEITKTPEYRWSSFREYEGDGSLTHPNFILSIFSKDINIAREKFFEFSLMSNNDKIIDYKDKSINYEISSLSQAVDFINNFLNVHNINKEDINKKINIFNRNKLIKELRKKSNLSIRNISNITGISRNIIHRMSQRTVT